MLSDDFMCPSFTLSFIRCACKLENSEVSSTIVAVELPGSSYQTIGVILCCLHCRRLLITVVGLSIVAVVEPAGDWSMRLNAHSGRS